MTAGSIDHRARTLVVVTAVLCIAVTFLLWRSSVAREMRAVESEFRAEAEHLAKSLQREIDLFLDVLLSVGDLHTLSDRISGADFEEFASKGMRHTKSVLGAFGFAQRIPFDLRPILESPLDDTLPLLFTESDGRGGIRPASERPAYFTLTYQMPPDRLGIPLGFDLLSIPGHQEALARMGAAAAPVLGGEVRVGDDPDARGSYVLAPLTLAPGPPDGCAIAVLHPQDLLKRAFDRSLVRNVQVALFDPSIVAPPPDRVVFSLDQPVSMADRPWVLRVGAQPAYLDAKARAVSWLVLGAGLAISALLVLLMSFLAGQTQRVLCLVQQRTAELEAANRKLSDEMQERARLEVALDEAAARERLRIGQNLHDSLGQKLTGAIYVGRALVSQIPPEGEAYRSAEKVIDVLKDAVAEVRRTARGLNPVDLDERGLIHALERLAEQTCGTYPVACSFRVEGDGALPGGRDATHLYFLAQEAVTNAVRHAEPREIAIRLDLAGRTLVIDNDGRPFAPSSAGGGAGLRIMRHRAQQLGASLDVGPRPEGGTRVLVRFV